MSPMLAVIEASICAHPSQPGKSLGNVGHVPSRELQVSPEVALPLPLHWEVGCELLRVCLVGVAPTASKTLRGLLIRSAAFHCSCRLHESELFSIAFASFLSDFRLFKGSSAAIVR